MFGVPITKDAIISLTTILIGTGCGKCATLYVVSTWGGLTKFVQFQACGTLRGVVIYCSDDISTKDRRLYLQK